MAILWRVRSRGRDCTALICVGACGRVGGVRCCCCRYCCLTLESKPCPERGGVSVRTALSLHVHKLIAWHLRAQFDSAPSEADRATLDRTITPLEVRAHRATELGWVTTRVLRRLSIQRNGCGFRRSCARGRPSSPLSPSTSPRCEQKI